MPVMLYKDLLEKFIHAGTKTWFVKTFEHRPLDVAVVVAHYPGEGAAQWVVATDDLAKEVCVKLGTRSRVWTLGTMREYLACFGDDAETVVVAATWIHREWYDLVQEGVA